MPPCPFCGHQFPLNYVITSDERWRYTDELVERLKTYDGLRLMGKYIGRHPQRIGEMSQVRQLYLSKYSKSSLLFLAPLQKLESLELDYTPITDLSGLEALRHLRCLALTECRQLEDISGLARSGSIRVLNIALCNRIRDLSAIGQMSELQVLKLQNNLMESIDFYRVFRTSESLS
jgi:Leucine-rich repeat (LRR) protein